MVDTDDIFKVIGKITVAVIGLSILIFVLVSLTGHMGVFSDLLVKLAPASSPVPTVLPTPTSDPVEGLRNGALSDYTYKLQLVDEQTQRLDTYYAAKTGTLMSQSEFQGWLEVMNAQTEDFIARENNATDSGEIYLGYLDANSSEYQRVIMNDAVSKSDTNKEIQNYNNNVGLYNDHWGSNYGYIANLSYVDP